MSNDGRENHRAEESEESKGSAQRESYPRLTPPIPAQVLKMHRADLESAGQQVDHLPPIPPLRVVSIVSDLPAVEPHQAFSTPPDVVEAGWTPAPSDVMNVEPPKRTPPKAPPLRRKPTAPKIEEEKTPEPPVVQIASNTARRKRAWWDELFSDEYVRTMDIASERLISSECDFIENSLSIAKGGTILDLACGMGGQAVELALRGYHVVGLDLSLTMLARASEIAQQRQCQLNLIQADMRDVAFDETFDGVYCWNTSFGYFEEQKNMDVLKRIFRSLRPQGALLLDVVNRDYIMSRTPSLAWFEADGCVCMDESQLDSITSRLRIKRTILFEDGVSREVEYSIRVYSLHELGRMLHGCGYRVVEVTGHTAHRGVFFGSESERIIILAEK